MAGMACLALWLIFVISPIGMRSAFFLVFSSHRSIARIMTGRTVNTQSILTNTPLASTIPISGPRRKLRNTSASRPTTVVSALEAMDEMEPASAVFIVSVLLLFFSFSWR